MSFFCAFQIAIDRNYKFDMDFEFILLFPLSGKRKNSMHYIKSKQYQCFRQGYYSHDNTSFCFASYVPLQSSASKSHQIELDKESMCKK